LTVNEEFFINDINVKKEKYEECKIKDDSEFNKKNTG